jgi:uncharacterized small protein (DUF1192 family)
MSSWRYCTPGSLISKQKSLYIERFEAAQSCALVLAVQRAQHGWMDPQITEITTRLTAMDQRLTLVEQDIAVLKATVATKDDIATIKSEISRLDATITSVRDNCATKADLAALETRIMKWMITTLVGVAGMNATLVLVVVRLVHV